MDSDLPLTPSPPPLPHVSYEWDECSTSPSPQTPTRYVAFCNISHVFCTRHVSTALTGLTLILTCLTLLLLSLTLRVLHNLVFDNTPVWLFLHVHVFDSTQVLFLPIILVWVLSLLTCLKLPTCVPYSNLVWNYYYLVWHYYSHVWQNTWGETALKRLTRTHDIIYPLLFDSTHVLHITQVFFISHVFDNINVFDFNLCVLTLLLPYWLLLSILHVLKQYYDLCLF